MLKLKRHIESILTPTPQKNLSVKYTKYIAKKRKLAILKISKTGKWLSDFDKADRTFSVKIDKLKKDSEVNSLVHFLM